MLQPVLRYVMVYTPYLILI